MKVSNIYTDGGVITKNPSALGGTWAWVEVVGGIRGRSASGIVTPSDLGVEKISNNVTELLAAVCALEAMPDDWRGTLYTDSNVTLLRLKLARVKFNGVPSSLRERCEQQKRRLSGFTVSLLAGHPARRELEVGYRKKDRMPVSSHNVFCDKECQRLARKFFVERQENANAEAKAEVPAAGPRAGLADSRHAEVGEDR